jgi:hypothetical protein
MNGGHDETIRDVSRTLVDLLKANLADIKDHIAIVSPKNAGTNVLTLFLYRVVENADLKNAEPPAARAADGTLVRSETPLNVDLHYLLTAHPHNGDLLEAHRAISRAMRVLFDHGILRGSLLRADSPSHGLTPDSVLRVTLNPTTTEEMSRIWGVFPDTPYEISVAYLVTPAQIESARLLTTAPVVDQVHEYGHLSSEPEQVEA